MSYDASFLNAEKYNHITDYNPGRLEEMALIVRDTDCLDSVYDPFAEQTLVGHTVASITMRLFGGNMKIACSRLRNLFRSLCVFLPERYRRIHIITVLEYRYVWRSRYLVDPTLCTNPFDDSVMTKHSRMAVDLGMAFETAGWYNMECWPSHEPSYRTWILNESFFCRGGVVDLSKVECLEIVFAHHAMDSTFEENVFEKLVTPVGFYGDFYTDIEPASKRGHVLCKNLAAYVNVTDFGRRMLEYYNSEIYDLHSKCYVEHYSRQRLRSKCVDDDDYVKSITVFESAQVEERIDSLREALKLRQMEGNLSDENRKAVDDFININSLKTYGDTRDRRCAVCMRNGVRAVVISLPCRHSCVCLKCYKCGQPSKCMICRQVIKFIIISIALHENRDYYSNNGVVVG